MPDGVRHVASLAAFSRSLRDAGIATTPDQLIAYAGALAQAPSLRRRELYWIGRVCLVSRRGELHAYDRAFAACFGAGAADAPDQLETPPVVAAEADGDVAVAGESAESPSEVGALAAEMELLRRKDFADCSDAELEAIRRALYGFSLRLPRRTTRRIRVAHRANRIALRATVREGLRRHGEILVVARARPRVRARRIVVLLDVSGSMAAYSRVLLTLAQVLTQRGLPVETFCFSTRLTRVTVAMQRRRPDDALADATRGVVDWDGGTRIGEALAAFLGAWGGMARGAVVIICSDGLERGDPERLRRSMTRLRRLAHTVTWLNPLLADPAYEPLARGMAAALPSVNELSPCHDLLSLEPVVAHLLAH